jgi:hypothetical protein
MSSCKLVGRSSIGVFSFSAPLASLFFPCLSTRKYYSSLSATLTMTSESSSLSLPGIQILLLALSVLCLRSIYVAYFSSLSKIPSAHPTSAFSRFWLLFQKWRGYENRARFAAHKRLGPVVRLSPYELSINSIEGVHTVYNNNLFERVKWYPNAFRGWE